MRNASIDNLRGLASLTVVLSHASGGYIPFYYFPLPLVYAIAESAYFAVVLFFVISGFLITTKLLEMSDGSGRFSLTAFYLGRVARIAPCLILFIGVASALAYAGVSNIAINWPDLPHKLECIFTFRFNVCMTSDATHLPRNWDPLWSLSIEEVFYLCFPPMLLMCRNYRWVLIIGLIALIFVGIERRYHVPNPWASFANFGHLATGVLAAIVTFSYREKQLRIFWKLGCQAVGLVGILYIFWHARKTGAMNQLVWQPEVIGLSASLYLFGSQRHAMWPLQFRPRLLERFGILSYEIYLFHMTFLMATAAVGKWIGSFGNPRVEELLAYLWTALFLIAMLGGATALHRHFTVRLEDTLKGAVRRISRGAERPADPFGTGEKTEQGKQHLERSSFAFRIKELPLFR